MFSVTKVYVRLTWGYKKIMQILLAENIDAGYKDQTVLHHVSIAITSGERTVMIGPNGCGKSTLLKVLAGTLSPTTGKILFKGKDVSHTVGHQRICKGMGYLMQNKNVFPSLTVEENLHLSFWHGKGEYVARRDWMMTIFPMLKERLTRRAGLLSGGERQALSIAMVLMRPVDILLLDEPTAGLSPKAAGIIIESVKHAQEEAQFSSLMVEHNIRLIQPWASRVFVMSQGRIVIDQQDTSILLDPDQLEKIYFG